LVELSDDATGQDFLLAKAVMGREWYLGWKRRPKANKGRFLASGYVRGRGYEDRVAGGRVTRYWADGRKEVVPPAPAPPPQGDAP
jgi:hypothetical protein